MLETKMLENVAAAEWPEGFGKKSPMSIIKLPKNSKEVFTKEIKYFDPFKNSATKVDF